MSGPEDLNGQRSLSSFFTPFGMMMMLSIDENGLGPLCAFLRVDGVELLVEDFRFLCGVIM